MISIARRNAAIGSKFVYAWLPEQETGKRWMFNIRTTEIYRINRVTSTTIGISRYNGVEGITIAVCVGDELHFASPRLAKVIERVPYGRNTLLIPYRFFMNKHGKTISRRNKATDEWIKKYAV